MSSSPPHPAELLLQTIEWQSEGPHIPSGDDGQPSLLVSYFSGSPRDRLPELWKTRDGRVLVKEQLEATTTPPISGGTAPIVQERLEAVLEHACENDLLPRLVLVAALEEGLHELVSSSSQQQDMATTTTTTTSSPTSTTTPPLYYSHPPSAFLKEPNSSPTEDEQDHHDTGAVSPSALLQRIKAGCLLAFTYHSQLQQYLFLTTDTSNTLAGSRRSSRLAPPTQPTKPHVLLKGGRVAQFLLEEYNKKEPPQSQEQEPSQSDDGDEKPSSDDVKEDEQNDKPSSDAKEVEQQDSDNGSEQVQQDDEDEEFQPEEDEDEEEDLEQVTEEVDEVSEPEEEDEESENEDEDDTVDDDDDDHDEETDLILQNPHLQPSLDSFLDWMGRRGKSLSSHTLQQAICHVLQEDVAFSTRSHLDRLVVGNHDDENDGVQQQDVVLECTSGERVKELLKMDSHEFQRCKFRCKLLKSGEVDELEQQRRMEEVYYAGLQYKRDKAWATWRYKGITTGHAVWPDWTTAAAEWRESNNTTDTVTSETASMPTQESDLALAQSMVDDEEDGRRRTRRGQADGGVFYGGQSAMSQKQLMDLIVRMASSQNQTMMTLQSIVAEESSNPLHRVRVALGKLVWKRNQLTRVCVNSIWTDMSLWKSGLALPVVAQLEKQEEPSSATSPTNDNVAAVTAGKNQPTKEDIAHLEILSGYLQNLYRTELQLRGLILQSLTTTSIATVAMAADERMGTLESLDDADFEDASVTLEWKTTGHELLGKLLFRPSPDTPSECIWYKINSYVPSVPIEDPEADKKDEPPLVERRIRFSAYPVTEDGEEEISDGTALILTEGQVRAGMLAGNMERKRKAPNVSTTEHPFASGAGTNVTLQSVASEDADVHCMVVGYDTLLKDDSPAQASSSKYEHRIMLLPTSKKECDREATAFWAVVSVDDDGVLTCQPTESDKKYKILQSDSDSSSLAFQECRSIVDFLHRQRFSEVFAEPVDPVALNIPTYFSVVKNPMDLSTLSSNLEKGLYSKIPPGQNVGRSPVARMLNGPFKENVALIFDNAMLFNPPDDWIYAAAASIKKAVMKKIDQVSRDADQGPGNGRAKRSVYVDEDSDVDMYEYESDRDDEDYGGRRQRERKRKRSSSKGEDYSTRALEAPINLQKTLSETQGLRGPFANLPINSEAVGYSLSSEWSCRHKTVVATEETQQDSEELKRRKEMEELLSLHRQMEEIERAGLRRSSRAHRGEGANENLSKDQLDASNDFEYFLAEGVLPLLGDEDTDCLMRKVCSSRSELETQREQLHEVYFAKLYQKLSKFLAMPTGKAHGSFANDSFPPFLGRVVPMEAPDIQSTDSVTWEIRTPYVIPAIRWVLRGLINSGHITELDDSVVLTNDIYYVDASQQPFDELDVREVQRRKRANEAGEEEESEEEVEMSEYEKMRAERVARNVERLKALGLA